MKYMAFWEFRPEHTDKIIAKNKQLLAEGERAAEKYPKPISDNFTFVGTCKGFQMFETDDPKRLTNMALHYFPELGFKFAPIMETKTTIELYEKTKK